MYVGQRKEKRNGREKEDDDEEEAEREEDKSRREGGRQREFFTHTRGSSKLHTAVQNSAVQSIVGVSSHMKRRKRSYRGIPRK